MSSVIRLWALALSLACLPAVGVRAAGGDPSAICDAAANTAAKEANIPTNVMRAITRVETGRRRENALRPWPWTVNMEGEGHWFDTEDAARAYVFRHFKQGKRSFDVGCFQINYRWHGTAFRSIDEMFDPEANARYAARFLAGLREEFGNWDAAVGAYHSRTKTYADRYVEKYRAVQAGLPAPAPAQPLSRNGYRLLQGHGGAGTRGSLVPSGLAGGASLFARVQ
jgi:hypothetical protein